MVAVGNHVAESYGDALLISYKVNVECCCDDLSPSISFFEMLLSFSDNVLWNVDGYLEDQLVLVPHH